MKSKYLVIKSGTEVNSLGEPYPDIMTFPINEFVYEQIPNRVILTTADVERFDLFCYRHYGNSDYTDILLWLNDYPSYHDLQIGDEILLPNIQDINKFYMSNI
jgi:hypothetical protein